MTHFLIIGHGAREHAMAIHLREEGHRVSCLGTRRNAGLERDSTYLLSSNYLPETILSVAQENKVDVLVPCNEMSLFSGIGTYARASGYPIWAPSEAAISVERSKLKARKLSLGIDPSVVPEGRVFGRVDDLLEFERTLAGRKVLKILTDPAHPRTLIAGPGIGNVETLLETARVRRDDEGVFLLEEFVDGDDFTISYFIVRDRAFRCPVLQDYPFRYRGNRGSKTGGMGCVVSPALPFLSSSEENAAEEFCRRFMSHYLLSDWGTGFFSFQFRRRISGKGIVFIELDARPGDPEMVSLLLLLNSSLGDLITGERNIGTRFSNESSVSLCLVPPSYPDEEEPVAFRIEEEKLRCLGIGVFYGGCSSTDQPSMITNGGRTITLAVSQGSIAAARQHLLQVMNLVPKELEFRDDIGSY
jgi:phosphoribosylamine---glycine ligase